MKYIKLPIFIGLIALIFFVVKGGLFDSPSPTDSHNAGNQNDSRALQVLAGSELKDIEPLLPQLEKDTGVRLKLV